MSIHNFISVVLAGTDDTLAIHVNHIRCAAEGVGVGGEHTTLIYLTPGNRFPDVHVYGSLTDTLKKIEAAK